MQSNRARATALVLITALLLAILPAHSPAYGDSPTRGWQLGLAVGLMGGFVAYMFWAITHEGGVSEREFDEERRAIYVREHRELDPIKKKAILSGELIRFMEPDEVYASWGRPTEIQELEGTDSAQSHWIWRMGKNRILHAYFLNGLLDRWDVERPEDGE